MADSLNMASDSVTDPDVSSDTVCDSPCKPCSDDDRNTEAVCFCFQCQTCFCHTCIGHHNKCFKTHSLFYKTAAKSQNVQQQSELMCDKHPGNSIQMYCGEHDVVSCAVCIAVDHRLCKSVDYIPKLAKEILNGRDRSDVKTSLEKLKEELQTARASKLEEINQVDTEKESVLNEVSNMTERIIARVKKLEEASVTDIQRRYDNIVDTIRNGIKSLDDMLVNTERQIKKIEQFKGDNEAKLFVLLSKAHEIESECMKYLESDAKALYDKISFQMNQGIESVLNDVKSLGISEGASFDLPPIKSAVHNVSLVGEFDVRLTSDAQKCCIIDSCMLDDGHLVIADSSNSKLKRLDETYNLKDSFDVSSLKGFCRTDRNELAVLNDNSILLVQVRKSMVCTHSFCITEYCEGGVIPSTDGYGIHSIWLKKIAFDKERFLISAELSYVSNHHRYERIQKYVVFIYDKKGCHLRTVIPNLTPEDIGEINHLSVCSYDSRLYFATGKRGLIALNIDGTVLSEVSDAMLKNVHHFTVGDNGQMYVCGKGSGNVFLLDKHGKAVDEVLGRYNGIGAPLSLMYIKNKKRILVACEKQDTVKIFQMK